ncbi:TonB-dependent siderophore receptor [[Pseudomonas] carboxydohydrogena]|uniref:TonB-dependent siderophore receptor n=1 Tax=Afipia carboxydohydrogena TaxID=290 RepID=A0ABY8BKX0_AFICR|nr:TonB-dependent siderophore receptor [[Pseudomonas] carboxydohydrogena]WEF50650.1 TonB-dependent siderophore receptor [[Pseudomonas] carboxydohydrogena]
MQGLKAPRSLRTWAVSHTDQDKNGGVSARKVTSIAGLIAVASVSGAEAQQAAPELPPVTVYAPAHHRATTKPSRDQKRATAALRRAAKRQQAAKPVPYPNAGQLTPPDADPYANAAAPYQATRLQSNKFSEPIANQPKTITVLTKDVLEDKNATSLREIGRSTAGVTLGSGEGGNAFGDRFFIRGFDARNDIFLDGIRDPAVSIRENFFTEQVEILRGPASSYAGRGTAGGAINIVTKQAGDKNFYNASSEFGTDRTKRFTLDVNQVISPTLSIRAGGVAQDAGIAGRNFATDERYGGFAAVKWTPTDSVKVLANYIHTDLRGTPDFGVPWDRVNNRPVTESGVPRDTWYGEVNRDFQKVRQDIGTAQLEVKLTPDVTFNSKFRAERSLLNYIGTIAEAPRSFTSNVTPFCQIVSNQPYCTQLNAQSRYQVADVLANQSDLTAKFDTGVFKHTLVAGTEFSREKVSIDKYSGLYSEANGSGMPSASAPIVSYLDPSSVTYLPFGGASLLGTPLVATVDTKSVYAIDTANYNDFLILNGGIRYDNYDYSATNYANLSHSALDSGLVNWNAGAVIKPLPYVSLYAAYATSSNPIGAELDASSASYGGPDFTNLGAAFGPERNKAAEVGTKWELFERRLLLTAALFQTEKDNAREVGTVGGVPNTIVAGAAYRIQGIDLEAAGKITDKWSIFGGLVLMDSKITKSNVAPPTTVGYTSNVGLKLANVAHQSFNVLTKYKFMPDWEVGGQATYRSKIYGGTLLAANQGTSLPSYWRFDAFLEHKVTKNLTMKVAVNNIFNKLYYDTLYQSAAPFVAVAPGRAAYITAQAKF